MKQLQLLIPVSFIICLIAISATASAAGFDYYGIKIKIINDELIENEIALKFDKLVTHLDYSLDFKIRNLEVDANFDEADCRTVDTSKGSDIKCDFRGNPINDDKRFIRLFFDTEAGVSKEKNNYVFTANYDVPVSVDDVVIKVTLPKNAALLDIFPPNPSTATINKSMTLLWEKEDLVDNKINFSVKYSIPVLSEEFYIIFIITITLVVIIIMIAMVLYVKRSPKKEDDVKIEYKTDPVKIDKEPKIGSLNIDQQRSYDIKIEARPEERKEDIDTIRVVTSVLREDERKIVGILESHEGKVIQKVIVRETDFSKAKVSRLVKNLKERGIIDVEPIGRTTKITLKIRPVIYKSLADAEKENTNTQQNNI